MESKDPGTRTAKLTRARELQRCWECPVATDREFRSGVALPPECREAKADVEQLIGGGLPYDTCPLAHLRLRSVHDASKARQWSERGMLRDKVGPPSAILIRCIEEIDRGIAERQSLDHEDFQRKIEEQDAERERQRGR